MTTDAGKPARKITPKGEAQRRKILDSAFRFFAANGFRSASIAEIAADVGITQAGMLYHYPSKEKLLLAVLRERDERTAREEAAYREQGLDWLQAFVRTLGFNDESPALVQLFAVLSAESITENHPAHAWFVHRYEEVIDDACTALADIIDPRALPDGATLETVARWIVAVADGWRTQWLLDRSIAPRQVGLALLLQALRPLMLPGVEAAWATDPKVIGR